MTDSYTDRILDAAYKLIKQHGLRRTTMADIVRASGVSKATLFRRFGNRKELLHSLMTREVVGFLSDLNDRIAQVTDPGERLVEIFVYFCEVAANHGMLRRLIQTDPETVLPLLTVDGERLLSFGNEFILAELRRAADAGCKLTAAPEICAELITRISHSYLLYPASAAPLNDAAALRNMFRATLVRLIILEAGTKK